MAGNANIGELRAGVYAGVEKLDEGIAASTTVQQSLEEAPALLHQAQEQLAELQATLGRLDALDGLKGSAAQAALSYRAGGMMISKTLHGAEHPDNQEAGSAAYALWQDKRLNGLRGISGVMEHDVERSAQSAQQIGYHLGSLATRLQGMAEENEALRATAQQVRDLAQERGDAL